MRRRRGFRRYKFTEKTWSKRGIVALIMALLSLIGLVAMAISSFQSAGNLSVYIACYGILAWMLAIVALVLAIRSLKEEDTFRMIPYISTVISVLAVLAWSAIYIGGMIR